VRLRQSYTQHVAAHPAECFTIDRHKPSVVMSSLP
jgi:hypothetical protein